ncbi:MAG: site-specific DNA-methyltransferase [Promethearchaeota archaeon]
MVKIEWNGKEANLRSIFQESAFHEKEAYYHVFNHNICPLERISAEIYEARIKKISELSFWKNLLFYGDNLLVLNYILKSLKEKINLIYFDPPFATGGEYNYKVIIGKGDNSKNAKFWIRPKAYNDSWNKGLHTYLNFIHKRIILLKSVLAKNGSIYVHLDWHISHYVKLILDEIFGRENFRNEIIWSYPAASVQTKRFFVRSYDSILFYTNSNEYIFNDDQNIYMEYSDRVKNALKSDKNGIYYHRGGSHDGKKLSQKVYIKKPGVFPRDVWKDIPYVRANTLEYQGFATQKPERLLKRIILASSNEGDIVADFFCGSGTTLATAEKLNRRWIGCDLTNQAIHITRKRILNISKSNDLFSWKRNYNQDPSPFLLIGSDLKQNPLILCQKFLSAAETNDFIIKKSDEPKLILSYNLIGNEISIEIDDYNVPFRKKLSKKILKNITSNLDFLDYWAIDYNYKEDVFNCMWTCYRTPKERSLSQKSPYYRYSKKGSYIIRIKSVDIFGYDCIKDIRIEI